MTSLPRLIAPLTVGTLLALAAGCATAEHERGETKVIGSIRPVGHMKPADLPAIATIHFDQALQTAMASAQGSVIKAELEVEDGNLMYSFEIVGADKKVVEVEIDAGNGKVLGIDKG